MGSMVGTAGIHAVLQYIPTHNTGNEIEIVCHQLSAAWPANRSRRKSLVRRHGMWGGGHILVGYGHPDDGTGVAPLPGTDHPSRLMCSGLNRSVSNGRHLVKSEWDEAETWLTNNIDNDQP